MARAVKNWTNTDITVGKFPQVKVAKIPFVNTATVETASNFTLPGPCLIYDVAIIVVDNVDSATIDVGTLSTGTDGDADGLVDGAVLTDAGAVALAGSDANTIGVFLEGADQAGSNVRLMKYLTSAQERGITYTTSDDAVTGYIIITYTDLSEQGEA